MKIFVLLFLICVSNVINAKSIVSSQKESFAEFAKNKEAFSPEALKKFYNALESSKSTSLSASAVNADLTAGVNEYVDNMVAQIQDYLMKQNLNELPLPDYEGAFSYKWLLVTYYGSLHLTDGNITNFASVHRGGDASVSYYNPTKYATLEVPLTFESLSAKYRYQAKIMGLSESGFVNCDATDITMKFNLGFDFSEFKVELRDFVVDDIGNIEVAFEGNILTDWLLDLVAKVVVDYFGNIIKSTLESNISNILVDLVATLNEIIAKFLAT